MPFSIVYKINDISICYSAKYMYTIERIERCFNPLGTGDCDDILHTVICSPLLHSAPALLIKGLLYESCVHHLCYTILYILPIVGGSW